MTNMANMTNMTNMTNTLVIIASCLMMDSDFRHDFRSTDCAKNRRICIHSYAKDKGWAAEAEKIINRESIRLLIEAEMGLDHPLSKSAAAYTLPQMMEAKKAYREATSTSTTSTTSTTSSTTSPSTAPVNSKDTTMSPITRTPAIEVTVQINVNGQNAANFSAAQLYGLIGQQEAEIAALQKLANKPQSLLKEVAARQAGIDALVAFLDQRDTLRSPQPSAQAPAQAPAQATDQLARS